MIRTTRNLVYGFLLFSLAALATTLSTTLAPAQNASHVTFMTAGDGSAFLPYGRGIAAYLAATGIPIEI
jgi:TRAP-type uncharacterized transport system substrate-binding protein